jgi:hypothetical protein
MIWTATRKKRKQHYLEPHFETRKPPVPKPCSIREWVRHLVYFGQQRAYTQYSLLRKPRQWPTTAPPFLFLSITNIQFDLPPAPFVIATTKLRLMKASDNTLGSTSAVLGAAR